MKKITLFAAALMALTLPLRAQNYDFESVAPSGQTLYYDIVDNHVEIVRPGAGTTFDNYVSGDLEIPATVTFEENTYAVTALASVDGYGSFEGCTGLTSIVIPTSVTSIGNYAFYQCSGLTSVVIPTSVISIGNYAFYQCSGLSSVTIPSSISSIPMAAFAQCTGLTYVDVGIAVSEIGNYAFSGCHNIQTLVLHPALNAIYAGAFDNCTGLTRVNYTGTIAGWCNIEFYDMSPTRYSHDLYINNTLVTNIVIPEGVTYVSRYAFFGCRSTTSISLPSTLDSIAECALFCSHQSTYYNGSIAQWCNIKRANSNPSMSDISLGNFYLNNQLLTDLTIPNSIHRIKPSTFEGCKSLHSVTIGNSVTAIDSAAFESCRNISSLHIGNSVSFIGSNAFGGCNSINSIIIDRDTPPAIGNNVFCAYLYTDDWEEINIYENAFVQVPCGSGNSYRAASGWSEFVNIRDEGMFNISLQAIGYDHASASTVSFDEEPTCGNPNYAVIRAVPASGCHFYGWTDGNNDNPRTVNLVSDTSFAAFFIENQIIWRPVTSCDSITTPYRANLSTCWQAIGNTTISSNTAILHGVGDTLRSPWISLANNGGTYLFYSGVSASHDYSDMMIRIRTQDGDSEMFLLSLVGDNLLYTFNIPQSYCGAGRKIQIDFIFDGFFVNSEITLSNISVSQFQSDMTIHGPDTVHVGEPVIYYATLNSSNNDVSPKYSWYYWMPTGSAFSDSSIFTCTWQDTGIVSIVCAMYIGQYECVGYKYVIVISPDETHHSVDTVFIHDTTYVIVHDTNYVNVYDTTYITVHDTTYIDVPYAVHDTTYIDVPYPVHDTTYINIHDTTYVDVPYPVHDTTIVHDTTYIDVPYPDHDTIYITQTDTLWLYDTVYLHDTIYIHDTIQVGIGEAGIIDVKVYQRNGHILVEGADGNTVTLYDVSGRVLATKRDDYVPLLLDVPASGTYMVKIGDYPARRVVVIK